VLILCIVLMQLMESLRKAGVLGHMSRDVPSPKSSMRFDAMIDIGPARFVAEERRRAPYPKELSEMGALRAAMELAGTPLLVLPFVSEALGESLRQAGWSWADGSGNYDLRAPGLLLQQRRTHTRPASLVTALPQGSGSFAIIRALIRFHDGEDEEPSATALAGQAGVTQPRASQVLAQLCKLELVSKTGTGRWVPDRKALLDRFLIDYKGPGGSEQYLYSLDPLLEVSRKLAHVSRTPGDVVISADVGVDLIAPWRRPSTMIVYARAPIDSAQIGLVAAQGRGDANIIIRYARDTSVFPRPQLVAEVRGVEVSLADPTQMIWDLHDLGGADRHEAAEVMCEWVLRSRP